jgi:hypothetical protein
MKATTIYNVYIKADKATKIAQGELRRKRERQRVYFLTRLWWICCEHVQMDENIKREGI